MHSLKLVLPQFYTSSLPIDAYNYKIFVKYKQSFAFLDGD